MTKLCRFFLAIFVMIGCIISEVNGQETNAPRPPGGFKIISPGAAVSGRYRDFSGVFKGELESGWGNDPLLRQEIILAVEEILPSGKAKGWYCWAKWKQGKPGHTAFIADLSETESEVTLSWQRMVRNQFKTFSFVIRNGKMYGKVTGHVLFMTTGEKGMEKIE
jgi:hypothetical protein